MQDKINTTLVIIGTGPAGYTASIYASRYKIDNLVIGSIVGGQAGEAHKICNFPSYTNISGIELMTRFQKHAQDLGAKELFDTVTKITGKFGSFTIHTKNGKEISAKVILLATGLKRRNLNIPSEAKFLGKGVSYCATCDATFYKDQTVAVIGGSDAANTASIYLSEVAGKVFQIYRRSKLRGEPTWAEQVIQNPKIEVIYNTNVTEFKGSDKLESIVLDTPYKDSTTISVDGVFVEIGSEPDPTLSEQLGLKTDDKRIHVNPDQTTNIKGILAAGDITTGSNYFRQIITACGEAAVAAETTFWLLQKETG